MKAVYRELVSFERVIYDLHCAKGELKTSFINESAVVVNS